MCKSRRWRVEHASMASWTDVRRIALDLPGTDEKTSHGETLAWTVNGKSFAWQRPLRRSDLAALGPSAPTGPILGIRTADLDVKDVLLLSDRNVFFTTPHFDGYAAVLVQLDKIGLTKLEAVIADAWLARAPKTAAAAFLAQAPPQPGRRRRQAASRPTDQR